MKNSYACSRFFIEHKALLLKALTSNEKRVTKKVWNPV